MICDGQCGQAGDGRHVHKLCFILVCNDYQVGGEKMYDQSVFVLLVYLYASSLIFS